MDLGRYRLTFHNVSLSILLLLLSCIQHTGQNVRHKRAATGMEPAIVTQNGHMVFKTGRNHNITFQSASGGFININGKDLNGISQQVDSNVAAITQLQNSPAVPPEFERRVTQVESRLNNLVPTGQVAVKFSDLTTRMNTLESNVPTDVNSRFSQIQSQLASLVPTGQVASRLNTLSGRLSAVESRTSQLEQNNYNALQSQVSTLQTTVTDIQRLLNTDECLSNPCSHGGTCIDGYNTFHCRCPKEFTGARCDEDVNECSELAGSDLGCQNGATCINTYGGYTCRCTSDYHGYHCTESHDDCTGASNEALCGHGTCVNLQRVQPGQPKYTCICDEGWTAASTADPSCTQNVNECDDAVPHCSVDPPVDCIDLPGTFHCGPCPAGYSGNGFSCVDINECLINNGGCSLAPRVDCINTRGSRRCGPCPAGYQSDGTGATCTWVGVCSTNNGGCSPQATCVENPGIGPSNRVCHCNPGYRGNGIGPNGCQPESTSGPCAGSPCVNGGTCIVRGTGFICACPAGYTGTNCQTNVNECQSSPCHHGGTCQDRINGFVCSCTSDWTGPTCDERQENCGGALVGESGSLRYPRQTGTQYPHGLSCAWSITTTRGKVLTVRFSAFNLESHPSCNYDFLQIHDGPTASAHQIGQYCGSQLPNNGTIISTHHQLYMWLRTDPSISGDGFQLSWTSGDPVCGGNMIADHGDISSPGYPGDYPHNVDCVWTISVTPGNTILFSFATLQIETHSNCSYDYLEFRDGLLDNSPILNRYCSTVSPAPLSTTGPYARIQFHTDASLNDVGFHITFAKVRADNQCGGVLTNASGVITSPGYPNPYRHNAQCVWTITVAAGESISLTFTNMDLEAQVSCQFDYVEVRDGLDESSNLIGRYCNQIPAILSSTGNRMWIKFKSDVSIRGTGFRATYTTGCGGRFTSPTGVIQSPYYPNPYPRNKVCTYLISQPEGVTITLSFSAFDVEGTSNARCNYDYLQVRDGGTEDATLLGTYCGAQIPSDISSTGNSIFLKFFTDGSVQNQGFSASYTSTEGIAGCGGTLTDMAGVFESPGHPNIYPHGANCTWFITVPAGLIIRLTFNTFSLERHSRCRFDSVEIFDNSTINNLGSSLGKYCGSSMPPVMTSSGNTMSIQLLSDSSLAFEGFSASYVALNASSVCGSELGDDVGVITSPGYPGNYPHNRECTWTIVVGAGKQILLNVSMFNLEQHPNCNYDYLEIRNGGFNTSPLVGKYCGTTIAPLIRSHSNRLYLKFKSDSSLSAPGFRITYDGTSSGCGSDLTTPTGSFVSPNYPVAYSHNGECFWTITTSRGSKLQLVFVDMDIETHRDCRYDYVQVKDGDVNGRELVKVCGTTLPDPIFSNTNRLWVKFRSDGSVGGRGFHAAYFSMCDTTLTDHNGVIESPNFPNSYPHSRNCTWIVQATLGNTINASFSHFDIESHSSCRFDYLQIRDGQDESAPEIMKACGRNIPDSIATTQQYMWVRFLSDASVAGNGFRLEYTMNGCGGYLNTPTGRFTSPNYPNPYPHRRVCEWRITVATGSAVKLTVTNFDLESHSSCRFDSLRVYGGMDDSAPILTTLCSAITSPQILTATGNTMFVRFTSDFSVSGNGFQANYESVTGGCGGNFTAQNGVIMSKNYPDNYPHNTECEWLISLMEGQVILLTFQDFDVEGSSNCRFDYVAVYDGNNQNSTELLRHCGNALPDNPIVQSTSNQMFIRMRSDGSVAAKGFKAQYVKGCGGTYNADIDGVIMSPNYPGLYDPASNCTWLLQAQTSSERITLTFTHMDIEESDSCDNDYVQIMDGDSSSSPVLDTVCGTTIPSTITSQGSSLFITFKSDFSRQRSGFRATYTTSVSTCGGDFTAEHGAFNSPNYPSSYPTNTECVWTISTSPGNRVFISFSVFNLENHVQCNYDYLELREGSSTGNLLGRFCGNTIPTNITAVSSVWLKFRSDASATGIGFMAQYNTVYGGDVTGTSGQIASPLYPNQYPHNTDYTWTITVAVGARIRITFVELDMEGSSTCVYDYIRFRDGGSATSALRGTYCGNTPPTSFISNTNQLRVEFHSDFSSTGSGFLFNWVMTSDVPISSTTPSPSTTAMPGCGGELVATHDPNNFTSPRYPSRYPNNLDCVWQITAEAGHRIWFNITDINLEPHTSCRYDVITVYDASFATGSYLGNTVGQFCGRTPNQEPIVVMSNRMAVKFTTDSSVTRPGFSALYKSICGGRIRNTPTGELHSPNYPNNYDNNANCTWVIAVSPGRTIQATFNTNFNIRSSANCASDYVQLLNGNNAASPPLNDNNNGQLCGTSAPSVTETASNSLLVNFVSDGNSVSSGFSMTWSEVTVTCGGSLTLSSAVTSGVFSSPNYPAVYPQNVDCIWVITAPASQSIQIDFDPVFNIESHSSCRWDYIEIRDGGTGNANLLGTFCGTTAQGTVRSTGNVMYARFRTDNSVARTGFQVTYQLSTCGGSIHGDSGSMMSPNYPSNYDNNADCTWVINGPVGHYLTFTFEAFSLQFASNCSQRDFVEIRDGNATGPVLMNRCGSSIPPAVDTSDSFGYVRFKSDGSVNRPGFKLNFQASVEACGGDLTTPTGTFTSPNFPGRYPHSRVCEWRIRVQQGRRVTLNFNAFELEDHSTCRWDYIDVYNGVLSTSPLIIRLCGQNPSEVESSGNTMLVRFRTDNSITNGGFSASYTSTEAATCGRVITTSTTGNITSPGYQNGNYSNNEQCIWLIQNRNYVNSSFFLYFADFHLESHINCRYDYLEIREGTDETSPLLNRFCGNTTIPDPVFSPSPNLWMRFVSDVSLVGRGFDIQYSFKTCGGILTDETGVITSPNYPSSYNHLDACAWQINAPEGSQIVVTFTHLDIELHPSCGFDYLEILNGGLASSPSIQKWCGTTLPANFTSQSNQLRVNFRTDASSTGTGFRLTYRFSAQGCGGLFHGNDGVITSPNFPQRYPHNVECIWTITVQPGYHVSLTFNNPFDLEGHSTCAFDYIQVYDVLRNGTQIPVGQRYCGRTTPPVQRSVSNRVALKLRTDSTSNGVGFSANWTTGCGATYIADSGVIVSPGFPGNYGHNLDCNYTILVDPQRFVVLSFDQTNFDIEGGSRCPYDALNVYAGNDTSGRSLGRFCGSTAPQPLSSLGSMMLRFTTDSSLVNGGFRANYYVSDCGGQFTSSAGSISSPTPNSYHNNINCTYNITVSDNRVVSLKFNTFDLEAHSRCRFDYVEIRDGSSYDSPLIGRFCGNQVPRAIKSTGSSLLVNFVTDSSVTRAGFTASYSETLGVNQGCGGVLNSTSGRLVSPDIDQDGQYESSLECIWQLIVDSNKVIRLTIPNMDIELVNNCIFDFLEIRDGMTDQDDLVGKLCGQRQNYEYTASSNALYLRFYTDGSVSGTGFNATFIQTTPLCGGNLMATSDSQTLSSPVYSTTALRPVLCRWVIDSPPASQVRLTVTSMNIQGSSDCIGNYLELRDRPLGDRGRSIHYCGATTPPEFDSVGRTVQVKFGIQNLLPLSSFQMTYKIADCNKTYTGDNGRITSPSWPNYYPHNLDCAITITSPPETMIALYFSSFRVEAASSCRFDSLQVYNGTDYSSTSMAKFCGRSLPDPFYATDNNLLLRFITDRSARYAGFDISYTSSPIGLGCGGNLTSINGTFTSPGYPGNYTLAQTCDWVITVPARRLVTVSFLDIGILGTADCSTDYVDVRVGGDVTGHRFGRYCGDSQVAPMQMSSNQAFIRFVSDGQGSAVYFRVKFTS